MTAAEVGIVTGDGPALVRFYEAGLGFEVVRVLTFPQGTVHRLRRDAAACKIFQPVDGAEAHRRPDPWHRRAGITYAALHVDDAAAEVAAARAAGAEVLTEPTSHRPDARYALVADPEGNVWEILEEHGD